MNKHPNQILNEAVALFALGYLSQVKYQKTGSRLNNAVWSFLDRSQIDLDVEPEVLLLSRLRTLEAAQLQRQLLTSDSPNTSLRGIIRQYPHLLPLVSHGPQALLLYSYEPLLINLFELDCGAKTYGYGQDVYRRIVDNVMAARLMFEAGTARIADKLFELFGKTDDLCLFEGGAGNGAATLAVLKKFLANQRPLEFLLSDLDEATLPTAEKLFRAHGYTGDYLPWLRVDLCNPEDIRFASSFLFGQPVISVNFIIHEVARIADNFFNSVSTFAPHAHLSITEFFLPEEIHPSIPEWFIFLHQASDQHLRPEADLEKIYSRYGYRCYDRVDHQLVNGKPLVSTLFLQK